MSENLVTFKPKQRENILVPFVEELKRIRGNANLIPYLVAAVPKLNSDFHSESVAGALLTALTDVIEHYEELIEAGFIPDAEQSEAYLPLVTPQNSDDVIRLLMVVDGTRYGDYQLSFEKTPYGYSL